MAEREGKPVPYGWKDTGFPAWGWGNAAFVDIPFGVDIVFAIDRQLRSENWELAARPVLSSIHFFMEVLI